MENQNDYLVKVKKNQPKLFEAIKRNVEKSIPISSFSEQGKTRGRTEYRNTILYKPEIDIPEGWCKLNRIIYVERLFENKDKIHYSKSYYISSVISDEAKLFATGIRGHWLIENKLHYVKDVIMREDYIKNNTKNASVNMSIIRNIAINIFKENGYDSIKHASLYFASNTNKLLKLLMCRT